ncbi:EAL domain-containing response regulator [Pseudomonas coleopterorum]|uniref:EAL domain-containing response regulator n=1 Tax=Pseudomonas coleopterorum TaxID=1605838 RepID=UPI00089CF580|nr:EAL domain-containing protein [Pseudomonas coleopterorum]SED82838.1 EAL domain, c-di-GMP-specific phosphodiesterase class I (or its enzymatically inactive variant) [Pseudomonas coleopterorum]
MSPYRVLIVEDHPFQHEYLVHVFNEAGGFNVDTVWDGQTALQSLAGGHYDLLLSDLLMPGMDGVQLIQQLATLDKPPVLALMSVASRRMLEGAGLAARNLGLTVAGLISKPVQATAVQRLRDCLDQIGGAPRGASGQPILDDVDAVAAALHNGQIQAWFQPKKSLCDGRIVGAEALARWLHPGAGLLMPGAFLGSVQRAGLEETLLWLTLRHTLAAQQHWRRKGYSIPVSINLPTHLLDQHDLADRLHAQVVEQGADPQQVIFELMETSTAHQLSDYYAGACRLRMKGFGLAQDDFGQGFSSYFNLVSTPFSELKLDRSLVHGCADNEHLATALQSIVELCRKFGLAVVAEGVETHAELMLLRRIGCEQVQGFLISPAVAVDRFSTLLVEDGPAPALS